MRFDMRRPAISPASPASCTARRSNSRSGPSQNGLASVIVSEHHGVDDGYLSSPMVMAGAIAGATKNIMINIAAVLAPLHDPLRLAEDIAVLDLASGGRLSLVLGLGYRPSEYAMFDKEWKGRGKEFDEMLGVLKQAWTGEPFEYQGRTVPVTPKPMSQPHPMIFIGGSSPNAAKRAAKHGMSFFPALGDPALQQVYTDECARLGTSPGMVLLPSGPGFVHVAEDPDKAWAEIGEYLLYETMVYASWQLPGQTSHVHSHATTVDELRAEGNYLIVTPEECVKVANELGPMGSLVLHPLIGGMPPDQAWSSLELIGVEGHAQPHMIKLICFVRRKPGMSADDFHRYWRDVHGPLIARTTERVARVALRAEPRSSGRKRYRRLRRRDRPVVRVGRRRSTRRCASPTTRRSRPTSRSSSTPSRLEFVLTEEPDVIFDRL